MSPSSAKEQSTKTTMAARVALNTGPAASSPDARKNKYGLTSSPNELTLPPGITPLKVTSISIPVEATREFSSLPSTLIVLYSATDHSFTPPSTQTPPPLSRVRRTRTPKRPRMIPPMSPTANGDSHTSPSQTSESDTITKMQNRLEAITKCTHTKTTNWDSQRDPIDKYTTYDTFPTVHEVHPVATLDNIDVQHAVDWVQCPGGKLLAIPFDNEAQNINAHHMIKSKIFTAATKIMEANNIGISSPTPSKDAQ
ncbi:hypothetical protein F5148DRAFT_1153006 [Russula earlei]|uniref:Uncharacterized protein n=1 Tax=Russula earlei TaxID=71964 RepID=A0ACC0TWV5_9AGAM|nr:hypothetical protein F5148DRAFT_1153006 [Russula earlei]